MKYAEVAETINSLPELCWERRQREGISLRVAATQIGTSPMTLSRVENGKDVSLANATAILRWLGSAPATTDD